MNENFEILTAKLAKEYIQEKGLNVNPEYHDFLETKLQTEVEA